MAYTKQTWENLPSQTTPINADRLTHIEDGIFNAAATADTAASNASSAISGLADKVDKVEGKGLSTNDFTDALKTKLDGIASGAEVNVQSDWNQSDNSADNYIKNKPSLGTSAYKNSTSVVTQSTDLVESGAVKDIVGWGNKNKFDLNGDSITSNATRTVLSDGINVKSSSASWASCIYFFKNVKNTDKRFKTSLDFVSGHTQIIIYGNSTPATAGATSIISSEVYTADGDVDLQFNSGDYEYLIIRFFVTTGTAEVGEANFNSIMLCNASDGNTYEPYHASVEDTLRDAEVVEGKNKLQNKATSSGIFTVNSDGTITANGTPTSQELINLGSQSGFNGNYILTGLDNTFPNGSYITVRKNNIWTNLYIRPNELLQLEFNLISTDVMEVFCVVSANTAITNKVFKPMLRKATESDSTYEPYYVPLKDVVSNKADNSVIGTVEGANASKAWSVGEHFIKDGAFKEVTQAIASGGAINDSNTVDKPIADCLAYKAGDNIVISNDTYVQIPFEGHLTTNGGSILVFIKLNKPLVNVNSLSFSASSKITVRGISGYILNVVLLTSLVVSIRYVNDLGVLVEITKTDSTPFDTNLNNTAINIALSDCTITLS